MRNKILGPTAHSGWPTAVRYQLRATYVRSGRRRVAFEPGSQAWEID